MEALQVLRSRLAAASLTAPADGEIIAVTAQRGDVARQGEPIIVLHAGASRVVVAYVSEQDGGKLSAGGAALLRRRTAGRQELSTRIVRVSSHVVQVPARFWAVPTLPQWGREVYLDMPRAVLDAGEAVDVKFLSSARDAEMRAGGR